MKRIIPAMMGFFSAAMLMFIVGYAAMVWRDPINFPIRQITFIGKSRFLSPEVLRQTIIEASYTGFLTAKMSDMQALLLALPWMKRVDIRKQWPNKLVIKFDEHIPKARWADTGVISTTGALFFSEGDLSALDKLAWLQGPPARQEQVWEMYLTMEAILADQQLKIDQLTLVARGAWEAKLSNGIVLNLGTDDIVRRLKRFVRIYKIHLQSKQEAIAYVDLRYTRGLVVGWKTG